MLLPAELPLVSRITLRTIYYYYACVYNVCVCACMSWLEYGGQRTTQELVPSFHFHMGSVDKNQVARPVQQTLLSTEPSYQERVSFKNYKNYFDDSTFEEHHNFGGISKTSHLPLKIVMNLPSYIYLCKDYKFILKSMIHSELIFTYGMERGFKSTWDVHGQHVFIIPFVKRLPFLYGINLVPVKSQQTMCMSTSGSYWNKHLACLHMS